DELQSIVSAIAFDPEAGAIMPQTGVHGRYATRDKDKDKDKEKAVAIEPFTTLAVVTSRFSCWRSMERMTKPI
ncbi:hypothetical protein, partial [uncultured Tateyamaria sp.]|uniref:hypothetical protein n=1 Tax=uncultured Tateyamaria sp. TaxID=455651 RepID=UPI00260BE6B6